MARGSVLPNRTSRASTFGVDMQPKSALDGLFGDEVTEAVEFAQAQALAAAEKKVRLERLRRQDVLKRRMMAKYYDDRLHKLNSKWFGWGDVMDAQSAAVKYAKLMNLKARFLLWKTHVRHLLYHKKRNMLMETLLWAPPAVADTMVKGLRKLREVDNVSWLAVDTSSQAISKKTTVKGADGTNIFLPLTAIPILAGNAGQDDIEAIGKDLTSIAEELREGSKKVVQKERNEYLETWATAGKPTHTKYDKKLVAPKHNMQTITHTHHTLLRLFDLMLASRAARTVERTAIFLERVFSSTKFLQLRIVIVPTLNEDGKAILQFEPSFSEVQAKLNTLIDGVVFAASMLAPLVPVGNSEQRLLTYLSESAYYRNAIQDLDIHLVRCFSEGLAAADKMTNMLGQELLAHAAILNDFTNSSTESLARAYEKQQLAKVSNRRGSLQDMVDLEKSAPTPPTDIPSGLRGLIIMFSYASHLGAKVPAAIVQSLVATAPMVFSDDQTKIDFSGEGRRGARGEFIGAVASAVLDALVVANPEHVCFSLTGNDASNLDSSSDACQWMKDLAVFISKWQESIARVKVVQSFDCLTIDAKQLLSNLLQTPVLLLSLHSFSVHVYAVHAARRLASSVETVLRDLSADVTSVHDLVKQMKFLGSMYQQLASFHVDHGRLDSLLSVLQNTVKIGVLADAIKATPVPKVSNAIEGQEEVEEEDYLELGGGGLVPKRLASRLKRLDDSLARLEVAADKAAKDVRGSLMYFHHKVQDDMTSINSDARELRVKMQDELRPQNWLGHDSRLGIEIAENREKLRRQMSIAARKSQGPLTRLSASSTRQSVEGVGASTSLGGESRKLGSGPILTRGVSFKEAMARGSATKSELFNAVDFSSIEKRHQGFTHSGETHSYEDVFGVVARYEKSLDELRNRRQMALNFEALTRSEEVGLTLTMAIIDLEKELAEPLAQRRTFWKNLQQWDETVDQCLNKPFHQVDISAMHGFIHSTVQKINKECAGTMAAIFSKRVNCFRRLLEPLFLVQFVVSLSSDQQSLRRQAVQLSLHERETLLKKRKKAMVRQHSWSSYSSNEMKQIVLRRTSNIPTYKSQNENVFSTEHNHIWEQLFDQDMLSAQAKEQEENKKSKKTNTTSNDLDDVDSDIDKDLYRGVQAITKDIHSLRDLALSGVLYKPAALAYCYELARAESKQAQLISRIADYWTIEPLPWSRFGDKSYATVIIDADYVRYTFDQHLTEIIAMIPALSHKVSDSSINEQDENSTSKKGGQQTVATSGFLQLADRWRQTLEVMLQRFERLIAIQTRWMKIAPIVPRASQRAAMRGAPPLGKTKLKSQQIIIQFSMFLSFFV